MEKTLSLVIDFGFQNQGPDMIQKGRLTLDMLQIMKVGRSGKVMEKGMPNVIKICQQIEALAVQGLIFEFLEGFEK